MQCRHHDFADRAVIGDGGVAQRSDRRTILVILLDKTLGLVRTRTPDVRTVADVDRYAVALELVLVRARRLFGKALVFADLRDAPVRSQEAADKLRSLNLRLYRPGERVALLVASSVLKMQLRRNLVADYQNIFTSPKAAEMWLQAASCGGHAPALEPAL